MARSSGALGWSVQRMQMWLSPPALWGVRPREWVARPTEVAGVAFRVVQSSGTPDFILFNEVHCIEECFILHSLCVFTVDSVVFLCA